MTARTLKLRVRMWQRRSGLIDWEIVVNVKPNLKVNGQPVHAATRTVDQRAIIDFDEETVQVFNADSLDHLICHELQHIIDDEQEDVFVKFLGKRAETGLFYREWAAANEKACDHRAASLVNAYKRKRDRH